MAVRIAFNQDGDRAVKPLPPPPRTEPSLLEQLGVPLRAIPGDPDLMHHKYVVRDWRRGVDGLDELDARLVDARGERAHHGGLRGARARPTRATSTTSGAGGGSRAAAASTRRRIDVGGVAVRAWFSPGRGPELSHRIAERIGVGPAARADRLAGADGGADPRGAQPGAGRGRASTSPACRDATQVAQVFAQWRGNENSAWKGPLLARVLSGLPWSGKVSTPYAPGAVHDYMHAKVTVADDIVFVGSFNLSRSGEENAENVLEIADAGLAERMAAFVDDVRGALPGDRGPRPTPPS